jgi:hypothetical protein
MEPSNNKQIPELKSEKAKPERAIDLVRVEGA